MPVPAIPPELVEQIFKQLPVGDAQTISTLVACTLVSRTFHTIAKHDSIWKPIADHRWRKGRTPTFVQLADQEDQAQMKLAFPTQQQRESPSVYQAIVARPHIKHIIDRHLAALLAEPANKIPHLLAIVELGEQNAMPFLSELARMSTDKRFPDDWLARRYWARQARGAISRRRAVDVWKRIGAGWSGNEAFSEGILAFSAFYGSQNIDEARPDERPFVEALDACLLELPSLRGQDDATPDLEMLAPFASVVLVQTALLGDLKLDPNATILSPVDPLPLAEHFANAVLGRLGRLVGAERLQAHPTVVDAIVCSGISTVQHGRNPVLLVRPVLLAGMSMLGLALARDDGLPVEASQAMYLMSRPPSLKDTTLIRTMRESAPPIFSRMPGIVADFTRPTPTGDLIYSFILSLRRALQAHQQSNNFRDGEVEDIASAHYACILASLFIKPSKSLTMLLGEAVPRSHALLFAGSLLETRYSCDVDFIAPLVLAAPRGSLPPGVPQQVATIKKVDAIPASQRTHSRSSSRAQILWKIGDIVGVRVETGDVEVCVVVGWEAENPLPFRGDADPATMLIELRLYGGLHPVAYDVINLRGEPTSRLDNGSFSPHRATEDELKTFTSIYDLGKYVKRVDETGAEGARFVIADDQAKVYPED